MIRSELVRAERFLIEKTRVGELPFLAMLLIEIDIEFADVDADICQQALCFRPPLRNPLDSLGASVTDQFPAIDFKFISLGMTSEIIMIIEDQDPSLVSHACAVKVRGGQSTDPGSDDDEVIILPRLLG